MYASRAIAIAIAIPTAKLKSNTASLIIPVVVFIGGLGGCASTPVSVEKMAVAESAVQRANTSATSENAAGELQIAVAKLASARQAVKLLSCTHNRRVHVKLPKNRKTRPAYCVKKSTAKRPVKRPAKRPTKHKEIPHEQAHKKS